ncbi:gene transfer agent family protein [Bartonella sp. LJL80]
MSHLNTALYLNWADGTYKFLLGKKEIDELERKLGKGIGEISQVFAARSWYLNDIYETIRLGLIGGGMGPLEAKALCDMYGTMPIADGENSPASVAESIIAALMFGAPASARVAE